MAKKNFTEGYKTYDTSGGFGNSDQWQEAFKARMGFENATQILNDQAADPYTVLGIQQGATFAEIKAAFRNAVKEWHPDLNHHRYEEADQKTKQIIAAYTVLTRHK